MREPLRICIVRLDSDDARADGLVEEIAAALGGTAFEITKVHPPAAPEELPAAALTVFLLTPFDGPQADLAVFAGLVAFAAGQVLVVESDGTRHVRYQPGPVVAASSPFGALPPTRSPVDPALATAFRLLPRPKGPMGPSLPFFGFVSSAPPELSPDPPGPVLPESHPPPSSRIEEPSPDLHLNAWFDKDPDKLVVGRPASLCVNLGPSRAPGQSSASEALSEEAVNAMNDLDHVEILVTATWADVARPWRKILLLPPDPAYILVWEVTPRRAGEVEISVVLAIHHEPVHTLSFSVTAADAEIEVRAT